VRHIVTFRLGCDTFALPVEPVDQILPMLAITPLPEGSGELADSVLGAINLRGQVMPVVDLRRHVGQRPAALERDTPLVVTHIGDLAVSLVVDEVIDVLTVREGDITPPGEVLPEGLGQAPVLAGLVCIPGTAEGRLALLLDANHLFAPGQRQAVARAVELLSNETARMEAGVR